MSVSAAKYLVSSSLPQLCRLDVQGRPFCLQTAAKVSEGNWPKLRRLSLRGSICSVAALQHIAKGRWPLLKSLDISRYQLDASKYSPMKDFDDRSLDPLQASHWPLLESLGASGWNCIHLSGPEQGCRWPKLRMLSTSHVHTNVQAPNLRHLHLEDVTGQDSLLNALPIDLPILCPHVHQCQWFYLDPSPNVVTPGSSMSFVSFCEAQPSTSKLGQGYYGSSQAHELGQTAGLGPIV